MMMMLGQVLCQLEPGELVAGGDAPYDPSALEIDEVPVCRTPGYVGQLRRDVRDADGVAVRSQELDDGTAARRIALVDSPQADLDQVVKVVALQLLLGRLDAHRTALLGALVHLQPGMSPA